MGTAKAVPVSYLPICYPLRMEAVLLLFGLGRISDGKEREDGTVALEMQHILAGVHAVLKRIDAKPYAAETEVGRFEPFVLGADGHVS